MTIILNAAIFQYYFEDIKNCFLCCFLVHCNLAISDVIVSGIVLYFCIILMLIFYVILIK